jgi:hypothetical protein
MSYLVVEIEDQSFDGILKLLKDTKAVKSIRKLYSEDEEDDILAQMVKESRESGYASEDEIFNILQ